MIRRLSLMLPVLYACACCAHGPSAEGPATAVAAPAAPTPDAAAAAPTPAPAPTPDATAVAPAATAESVKPAYEVDLGPVADWYQKTPRRARLNQSASAADLSLSVNLIEWVLHRSDAVWARMEPAVEASFRQGGGRLPLAFGEVDAATAAEYHKVGAPLTSKPREQRDPDAEERIFAKGLLLAPGDPDFYHHLAVCATLREDYKQAERWAKLAIAIDPNFIGAYQELAYVYKNSKRYDDAVAIADRGVNVDGDIRTKALLLARKGQALWMQGKKEEALGAFRRSQRLGGPEWISSYLDGKQEIGKEFAPPPADPAVPAVPPTTE